MNYLNPGFHAFKIGMRLPPGSLRLPFRQATGYDVVKRERPHGAKPKARNRDDMTLLPDDALVVRGGKNLPENFAQGSGVGLDADGKLENVSVNSGALPLADLTRAIPQTGYLGIPHRQVGVTTVGEVRKLGGEVSPAPTKRNPHHALLKGLTPDQASRLFRPTRPNPSAPP